MTRAHSDAATGGKVIDLMQALKDSLAQKSGRATLPAPAPGVYANTPMELYHRWNAASNSRLTKLRRSPAHLKAYLDGGDEDTAALIMGRAVHSAILEPDDFAKRYCRGPEDRRTKEGKAQYEALLATHEPGTILKRDDFEAALHMRDSVHAHVAASELLTGSGDVELSLVWESLIKETDENGVTCKARLDRINQEYEAIIDVKSTRDASRREFERSIFEHGYHRQGAFYLHAADVLGIPVKHFVIIAVEKEPPYAVGVYRLTPGAIEAGRDEVFSLLKVYATCEALNEWPAYPQQVEDIALPTYAWGQIEDGIRQREERVS